MEINHIAFSGESNRNHSPTPTENAMGMKLSTPVSSKPKNSSLVNGYHKLLHYVANSFFLRNLVSKSRRRMLVAGYDLDMSYITDRLLAMSYPGERVRALYRNPIWQVRDVLDTRHPDRYKVYNLCIEENYDPTHFHGRVEIYPFDDNHVPPLSMVKLLCESIYSWLSSDPENIAVIHCMAGKGRTGLMVCSYLVYSGMSVDEALQLYAHKRTTNNRGVSIPSQRRYVRYWSEVLQFHKDKLDEPPTINLPKITTRELRRIRLYDTININSVFFVAMEMQDIAGQLYRPSIEVAKGCCREVKEGDRRSNSPRYYLSYVDDGGNDLDRIEVVSPRVVVQMDTERSALYQKTCLDYCFESPLQVAGDLRVVFYEKLIGSRLFYVCFNMAFIKGSMMQFSVRDLDKVGHKGKFICGQSFSLELFFGPANAL
ncbi:phosphatidylinositol 3,4,5-trisphosphate 3-phosphatase and protein-tyrosine-phosphatase PTEN1 isoform X2 [Phalaenopsis equestris]|uniref:phosphatidylinositol 3,4,5-trisphosphate 3-phosphatase and protein-tyrosine-phosphatase PTEN1 isoform X2 n=1 Tax=Phalaenopsis equestris TaxID=78828 RepID=UPI0009E4F68D|nr:phosphatidylinositol 3,4,5-trisphosphate 3-phosphatase and protein-tyrosine-phosphatase PTEN1 isoform X2 [Phalaenopsis equestris]